MTKRGREHAVAVLGLRRRTEDTPATVIVVDTSTSDTSLVATALHHLGAHIDVHPNGDGIAQLIGDGDRVEELQALIEEKSALDCLWGFEMRETFRLLPSAIHLLPGPRVVITFRDPLAMVDAGKATADSELVKRVTRAATDNLLLAEMLRALPGPTLLVSYEKALAAPGDFVAALAEHCGIDPRESQRLRAIRSIESGRESNPPASPVWYEGDLEGVGHDNVARGWARRMPGNEPCMIEIVYDGTVIGRGLSSRPFESDDEAARQRGFAIELAEAPAGPVNACVAGTSTALGPNRTARASGKQAGRAAVNPRSPGAKPTGQAVAEKPTEMAANQEQSRRATRRKS